MTNKEIERMVGLADDIYIDEMFTTKIPDKRSFFTARIVSAAAAAVLIAGAGIASLFIGSGGNNDISDLQTIVSGTETDFNDFGIYTPSETTAAPKAKRLMPIDYDEDFDYSIYFQQDRFDGILEYTIDVGGNNYYFNSDYVCETVPFDTSPYDEPKTATVFCDESGKPVNAHIFCYNVQLNSRSLGVDIIINDDGNLFPEYWFDTDSVFEDAPERFGVKIAGYTRDNQVLDYKDVCAVFDVNGVGYTVNIYGMTYAQAVGVIDSLIESSLKAADFDISKGIKQNISLMEANGIEPYARYVPTVDKVSEMALVNCERQSDINGEHLYIIYEVPMEIATEDHLNINRKFIALNYYTSVAEFEENIHIKGSPDDLYANVGEYEQFKIYGDIKRYEFNFVMNGFYINGQAICTEEELTEYLKQLRYQSYIAAQSSANEGVEIYNDKGVPPVCADYLYDYWFYVFKFRDGSFDTKKYFTDPDMLRYAGYKKSKLADTESNGITGFKIISHGASGGTTKDGKDWVKIDYDVDVGVSKEYTGDDYYRAKSAYMGYTAYFEIDSDGKIYRAFDQGDLRAAGIDKNNAEYPLDELTVRTLFEISNQEQEGAETFNGYSTLVPLGHRDESGVSFTEDVKNRSVTLNLRVPAEWNMNGLIGSCGDAKMFEIGAAWFASEGYDPEDYKIDMALGKKITVIDEKYGSEEAGYEYMIHRSIPDYYSDTGYYESYIYVLKQGDYYMTLSFVVNEYFNEAYMQKILRSVKFTPTEAAYTTEVKVGHPTESLGGVGFYGDEKTAVLSFNLPSEWKYSEKASHAEYKGEEMFVYSPPWLVSEGFSTDPKEEMRGVTYEEKYGTDGLYEFMRHTSVRYYDGTESRSYEYILKRGDYYIFVLFYDNEYFNEAYMENVLKSVEIKSVSNELSLSDANKTKPFTGYVPQLEKFGDIALTNVSYDKENGRLDVEWGHQRDYMSSLAVEKYINLHYYPTLENYFENEDQFKLFSVDDLTKNKNFALFDVDETLKRYKIRLLCNKFYIEIWAVCTPDELWECLSAIKVSSKPEASETSVVQTRSETVSYHGREFVRENLSEKTLEWLDWYNSLSKDEQLSISYEPAELR